SVKSLDKNMRALEDYARTAPHLTITLAAPAPASLKQTLTAWCRQNLAPNMLVTFEFNSSLCGGMVVRYGSRMFDWSFRRQIMENKQKFPEVLRNV
ncbi:MAG TPA: F0F1 ATP synthase subunit delta, partial [Candidatus Saccharimonadales bacterium]|nr:F0F1 ATP synthase subunit delta [Candidatus Saccharimonadales bacterium]